MKIEQLRIKTSLENHSSKFTVIIFSYYIAIVGSAFYLVFQSILSAFDKYSKGLNIVISMIYLLAMLYYITSAFRKGWKNNISKNLMLNLSLQVLQDIEKEQVKVNEEAVKLENRKWIEQNFNKGKLFKQKFIDTQNEVAATEIKSNEDENKKLYKNPKNIGDLNGFINIVFYKKFSNKE